MRGSVYIVGIAIAAVVVASGIKLYQKYREKINFFITGLDSKFSFPELALLWRTAKVCRLQEPLSLFWSLASLTRCISEIKSSVDKTNNASNQSMMKLLTKLYEYRTHIDNEADKKRGLESTHSLDNNQRLRIILPGKGVFASKIVNNARELTISVPTQNGLIPIEGKDWIGKSISVYLWRTGDARYVFDTTVLGDGLFLGHPALFLKHSQKLLRTQKRKAIRAKCSIYASLFIIKERVIDYNAVETKQGYRCLIEDISESGAMIRIGGKGVANIQLKIQFTLEGKLIIMFGVVRTVEYNQEIHQSRLHFECMHVDPVMRNEILSFVYNILPTEEKEIFDAISLTGEDEQEEHERTIALEDLTEDNDNMLENSVFASGESKIPDTTDMLLKEKSSGE